MRALVVGGTGWVGSRLLPALAAAGVEAVALRRAPAADPGVPQGDLLDASGLARVVEALRPELVVHLAGRTRPRAGDGPGALYRVHVEGTANLIDALAAHAPGAHLIGLGSAAEYGPGTPGHPIAEDHPNRPVGHYGLSKLLQTELLRRAAGWCDLEVTVLRGFNLIGPGMPPGLLLSDLFARLRQLRARGGGVLEIADADAVRDLVPVEILVEAVARVARRRGPPGVFNVATGVGTRVGEVVEWLRGASDFEWTAREVAGSRGRGGWSVGNPAALEGELGPLPGPSARDAVLAAYRRDVLETETVP